MKFSLLQKRTGPQWIRALQKIDDITLRVLVSRVVWWDFFGGFEGDDQVDSLDDLAALYNSDMDAPPEIMIEGLKTIGYEPKAAIRRMKTMKEAENRKDVLNDYE